jgi:hypothetical protein
LAQNLRPPREPVVDPADRGGREVHITHHGTDPGLDGPGGDPRHIRGCGGRKLLGLKEAAVLEGVESGVDRALNHLRNGAVDRDAAASCVHSLGGFG